MKFKYLTLLLCFIFLATGNVFSGELTLNQIFNVASGTTDKDSISKVLQAHLKKATSLGEIEKTLSAIINNVINGLERSGIQTWFSSHGTQFTKDTLEELIKIIDETKILDSEEIKNIKITASIKPGTRHDNSEKDEHLNAKDNITMTFAKWIDFLKFYNKEEVRATAYHTLNPVAVYEEFEKDEAKKKTVEPVTTLASAPSITKPLPTPPNKLNKKLNDLKQNIENLKTKTTALSGKLENLKMALTK